MKKYYYIDINIGQGAIGGIPMSEAMIIFEVYQVPSLEPGSTIIKRESISFTQVRWKDFVKDINTIDKDHRSDKAREAFRNIKQIFGMLMHSLNEFRHEQEYEK